MTAKRNNALLFCTVILGLLLLATPIARGEELPSAFDLRNVDGVSYVTPERHQGKYGSCWIFSAIAAAETNLLLQGLLPDTSADLSELQLLYYTFNQATDPLGNFTGDHTAPGVDSNPLMNGGNAFVATYMLARWTGPAVEVALPYGEAEYSLGAEFGDALATELDVAHLQNAYWISPVSEAAQLKSAIMTYGGASLVFHQDSKYYYNTSDTVSYYCPKRLPTTHAVTIVGWDDNFPRTEFFQQDSDGNVQADSKQPDIDGAWLVKNSNGYGRDGFFWISYADASMGNAVVFDFEPADNYDHNYQYDGSGCTVNKSFMDHDTVTTANVFTCAQDESLEAVSFYIPKNAGADYTVRIYELAEDYQGIPDGGSLLTSFSGSKEICGYFTVELPQPQALTCGTHFSVVIDIHSQDGEDAYYAVDRSDNQTGMNNINVSQAGQSYTYSPSFGRWNDVSKLGENNRIKAFTREATPLARPTGLTGAMSGGQITLEWNAVNGAAGYQVWRQGEGESAFTLLADQLTANSYTYTPQLDPGAAAYYKVKAYTAEHISPFSAGTAVKQPTTWHLKSIAIWSLDEVLEIGDTYQLGPDYADDTGVKLYFQSGSAPVDDTIAYYSSNPAVATVDADGRVQAQAGGKATIYIIPRDRELATENNLLTLGFTVTVPQLINAATVAQLQSAHPYKNGVYATYVYNVPGASSITFTFSEDTQLYGYSDCIIIKNGSDVQQRDPYYTNSLAGKTVTVAGDTVKIQMITEEQTSAYGFRVVSAEAAMPFRDNAYTFTGVSLLDENKQPLTDSNGEPLTQLPVGRFILRAAVERRVNEGITDQFLLAAYDAAGRLVEVTSVSACPPGGSSELDIPVMNYGDYARLRLFVVPSLSAPLPLAAALSFPIQ